MKLSEWTSVIDAVIEHPLLGANPSSVTACALGPKGVREHLEWMFDDPKELSSDKAIKEMVKFEDAHVEQALNCRWGEDSDPELLAYRAWQELKTKHHYT
jgi:hypothetical protein